VNKPFILEQCGIKCTSRAFLYENSDYKDLPVTAVGWAARFESLVLGFKNETFEDPIYRNDKQRVPQCSKTHRTFSRQDRNSRKCPGGKAMN
jgi:hypothetical protein